MGGWKRAMVVELLRYAPDDPLRSYSTDSLYGPCCALDAWAKSQRRTIVN
jgi:hypothetical protein